jgi:transcription termination/antitermination protein NusA
VTTVEALADMTPEQLEAIEGIGPKTVEKISLAVNNYFSSLEAGEAGAAETEGEVVAEPVAEESAGAPEDITAEVEAAPEDSPEATVEAAPADASVEENSGPEETAESAEEPAPSEEKQ